MNADAKVGVRDDASIDAAGKDSVEVLADAESNSQTGYDKAGVDRECESLSAHSGRKAKTATGYAGNIAEHTDGNQSDPNIEALEFFTNISEFSGENNERLTDVVAQRMLGDVIAIVEKARNMHPRSLGAAKVAADFLLSKEPKVDAASQIIASLSKEYDYKSPNNNKSPALGVFLGLGSFAYFVFATMGFISLFGPEFPEKVLGMPSSELSIACVSGAIGSTISMMLRIQYFDSLRRSAAGVSIFIGLFRPIVGMAFAVFVYAALKSGLIPISIEQEKFSFFLVCLSFAAGFSERLAPDLVARIEKSFQEKSPGEQSARP